MISSLSYDQVLVIYEDKHEKYLDWNQSGEGLNMLDTKSETFVRYNYSNKSDPYKSKSRCNLLNMYEDSFGDLWIGTLRWRIKQVQKNK